MKADDRFYEQQEEPVKSCLLALKKIILEQDKNVSAEWKYGMPFYCYNKKMFCYLWVHKKYQQPYLGIVEGKRIHHADLLSEKRSRMKILLIDPEKDLPIKKIKGILNEMLSLYRPFAMKAVRSKVEDNFIPNLE